MVVYFRVSGPTVMAPEPSQWLYSARLHERTLWLDRGGVCLCWSLGAATEMRQSRCSAGVI